MSEIEGEIEEISGKIVTKWGSPMINITVGGVRMGKFFDNDNDWTEFLSQYHTGQQVAADYLVNGKYKNLIAITPLNNDEQSTLEPSQDTDNKIAKAALKVAGAKTIKDGVTGKDWSRDAVVQQIRKDVRNIREMLDSMEKLAEAL